MSRKRKQAKKDEIKKKLTVIRSENKEKILNVFNDEHLWLFKVVAHQILGHPRNKDDLLIDEIIQKGTLNMLRTYVNRKGDVVEIKNVYSMYVRVLRNVYMDMLKSEKTRRKHTNGYAWAYCWNLLEFAYEMKRSYKPTFENAPPTLEEFEAQENKKELTPAVWDNVVKEVKLVLKSKK